MKRIIEEDTQYIFDKLSSHEKSLFQNKIILTTGFAGSLGYLLLSFLKIYRSELGIKKIYGIDNYIFGKPKWLEEFAADENIQLIEADITTCDLTMVEDASLILHMASLASPVYYRLHPIETIDADVIGLRRLLDFFKNRNIYDLLFFSTSEIYGNPPADQIPTKEEYFGYVNPAGPRACYDESKRFGETLCYNYSNQYNMPITIIRPFNSFGPGLRVNDLRVVADFALNVINNEDIIIYSNGKVTRTFCYGADTVTGILKCALYGKFDTFNIGYDKDEMSIAALAKIYQEAGEECFSYHKEIRYKVHEDADYLTDNPQRRCPDIAKAKRLLDYHPEFSTKEGVSRYLEFLRTE